MSQAPHILAIDQGTTSTRALLFDAEGRVKATASAPLEQSYPHPGWVEHDPQAIWDAVLATGRNVLRDTGNPPIAGIGITNQRETVVFWDRETGNPCGPAIVWQDRRTESICQKLRDDGLEAHIRKTTGLVIDPYFSATKIAWALRNDSDLAARASDGEICFGTIDSWLIYRLTGGAAHVTDATNASRTMLFDIHREVWDRKLLEVLDIPLAMMPSVTDCQAALGHSQSEHFGEPIPVLGVAGDQQAALVGQACFEPGMIKATYGTGCFVLVNTGNVAVASDHRMLTTIAYRLAGRTTYALEGSIFMAGATIQWLRDSLGLFKNTADTEAMAVAGDPDAAVYLVPAFQGLGAPDWDAEARGAILGLSRASTPNDIVRAGLEAVAFQTRDLLDAIRADMAAAGLDAPTTLRVDGGMTSNRWLMQTIADTVGLPVEVAPITETTAFGSAIHAALQCGLFESEAHVARLRPPSIRFDPRQTDTWRNDRHDGWREAVERVLTK